MSTRCNTRRKSSAAPVVVLSNVVVSRYTLNRVIVESKFHCCQIHLTNTMIPTMLVPTSYYFQFDKQSSTNGCVDVWPASGITFALCCSNSWTEIINNSAIFYMTNLFELHKLKFQTCGSNTRPNNTRTDC